MRYILASLLLVSSVVAQVTATAVTYGQGCASPTSLNGFGPTTFFGNPTRPLLGNSYNLFINSGGPTQPSASWALLVYGAPYTQDLQTSYSLASLGITNSSGSGCQGWVLVDGSESSQFMTLVANSPTWYGYVTWVIPNDPGLLGVGIASQVIVNDPTNYNNAAQCSATNACYQVIGNV